MVLPVKYNPMQADEMNFLEDSIANAELLNCAECGEETLHTHEEVLGTFGDSQEVLMRCTVCMATRTWLDG